MKLITLILVILLMYDLAETKTGKYLNGRECLEMTEENKGECDERCAHKICLADRFEKDEQACYDEYTESLPEDELKFLMEKSTKQTSQLRRYFAVMMKNPAKVKPEAPKRENLLEIGSQDYVNIIKTFMPSNDYKAATCDASMNYTKVTDYDEEWWYASCKDPETEKCRIFMENRLRAFDGFRKILKTLHDRKVVYALNKLPIYNVDRSKTVALHYQSIINDHIAMHMASEMEQRAIKDEELGQKIDDLQHSLAAQSRSIRERHDNELRLVRDNVALNVLELNKKVDRVSLPKKGEVTEDGSGNQPTQEKAGNAPRPVKGDRGPIGPPGNCPVVCTTQKGDRGMVGEPGNTGHPGREGKSGIDGADGLPGTPGIKGEIGEPGVSGLATEADWKYLELLDLTNEIETPSEEEEKQLRSIQGKSLAIEDHSRTGRDTDARSLVMYAASALLKVPTAKLRAVEALANNLLHDQKVKIEESFRRIAAKGWNQTKHSFLASMGQQLSSHPLFVNRGKYAKHINMTREEFDLFLRETSKDPHGTFAMVAIAASTFASLAIIGTACMNYRASHRVENSQTRTDERRLKKIARCSRKLQERTGPPSPTCSLREREPLRSRDGGEKEDTAGGGTDAQRTAIPCP